MKHYYTCDVQSSDSLNYTYNLNRFPMHTEWKTSIKCTSERMNKVKRIAPKQTLTMDELMAMLSEHERIEVSKQLSKQMHSIMRKAAKNAVLEIENKSSKPHNNNNGTSKSQDNNYSYNNYNKNSHSKPKIIVKSRIHTERQTNLSKKVQFKNCCYPTKNIFFNWMHRWLHDNHICIHPNIVNTYTSDDDSDDAYENAVNPYQTISDINKKIDDFESIWSHNQNCEKEYTIQTQQEMFKILKQREKYKLHLLCYGQRMTYYTLDIELTGIKPLIYRTIVVWCNVSLAVLHDKILCILFGWRRNYHAYQFRIVHYKNKNVSYGCIDSSAVDMQHLNSYLIKRVGRYMVDANIVYLSDVMTNVNDKLRYIYDLGDLNHHTITLKRITVVNNSNGGINTNNNTNTNTNRQRNIWKNTSNFVINTNKEKNRCKTTFRNTKTNSNTNKNNFNINVNGLVTIIDGARHGPPESTDGNRGYVEKLEKLRFICNTGRGQNSYNKNKKEFFQLMGRFGSALNVNFTKFDSEEFNLNQTIKKIYYAFQTGLSSQSDRNMYDFNYNCAIVDVPDRSLQFLRRCFEKTCRKGKKHGMKLCKRCKSAYYCDRKCQKKDWVANHRYYCFDRKIVVTCQIY